MVEVGFWIYNPSKIRHFHQHWEKNTAETLQFEDLAVIFFIFFIMYIFLWTKSWIGSKCNFYESWRKKFKHFAEKNHSLFEELKGSPFKHTKKIICEMFYLFKDV